MSMSLFTEGGDPILTEDGSALIDRQSLRDSVMEAAAARLAEIIPDVPVDRARRAGVASAEMPRLVLLAGAAVPDESQSPMETFWTFSFVVAGYVTGSTDEAAEQELSLLHARVMEAMQMATLGPASVMPTVGTAEMALLDADESARPIGQFAIPFQALAIAPTAYPYAP